MYCSVSDRINSSCVSLKVLIATLGEVDNVGTVPFASASLNERVNETLGGDSIIGSMLLFSIADLSIIGLMSLSSIAANTPMESPAVIAPVVNLKTRAGGFVLAPDL